MITTVKLINIHQELKFKNFVVFNKSGNLRVSQAHVVCLCSQLQSKNICPHLSITTPLKWVSQTNPW